MMMMGYGTSAMPQPTMSPSQIEESLRAALSSGEQMLLLQKDRLGGPPLPLWLLAALLLGNSHTRNTSSSLLRASHAGTVSYLEPGELPFVDREETEKEKKLSAAFMQDTGPHAGARQVRPFAGTVARQLLSRTRGLQGFDEAAGPPPGSGGPGGGPESPGSGAGGPGRAEGGALPGSSSAAGGVEGGGDAQESNRMHFGLHCLICDDERVNRKIAGERLLLAALMTRT